MLKHSAFRKRGNNFKNLSVIQHTTQNGKVCMEYLAPSSMLMLEKSNMLSLMLSCPALSALSYFLPSFILSSSASQH